MLIEFASARPPGLPGGGRAWQRSYWPGGVLLVIGLALLIPAGPAPGLPGQILAVLGGCLLGSALVERRRRAAAPDREPRHWTITDVDLRSGNRLGSVWCTWKQVRRVVERPEVYLLYPSDSPHTAVFDVPRGTLTPEQDAEFRAFLAARGLRPAG